MSARCSLLIALAVLPACFQGDYDNPLDATAGTGLLLFDLDSGGGSSAIDGKYLFFTSSSVAGNIGNVAAADSACQSDGARPNGSTYKALLVDSGGARLASLTANVGDGQVDWVLAPDTKYYRNDNTLVATSNSAGLLPATLDVALDPTASKNFWVGMGDDWVATTNDCSNWGGAGVGSVGSGSITTSYFNLGVDLCANPNHFICVEQ